MSRLQSLDFMCIGRRYIQLPSQAVLLVGLMLCAGASWGEAGSRSIIEVSHRKGTLTVTAVNATLSEVLYEISRQSGIKISLTGQFDEQVTRTVINASVADVIRQLTNSGTFVIIHDQARAGEAARGIQEIWLYRGISGQAPSVLITRKSTTRVQKSNAADVPESPEIEPDQEIRRQVSELSELSRSARISKARELALRDDPAAVAILGEMLALDEDWEVRMEAVKALRNIGDERAVESLERGLGDTQVAIRLGVVHAIGASRGDRALLGLGQVVFGEQDPEVRRLAVEYLSQTPAEAARAFLEAASNDSSEIVRDEARRALGLE